MSCDKYREMISAGLDNELSGEEQKTLDSHLETCSDCGRFANELRSLMEESSSLPAEPMPLSLEAAILNQTTGAAEERKSLWGYFHGYYRVPRGLAWAAMLAALLLITDAIVKSNIEQATVEPAPTEIQVAQNNVKKIVLTEDDIVSTSTILRPSGDS